jgi:uncharacterized protein YndB with AHSA1/START domain
MNTETPQLVISRVFDAPRQLVYRAFTDLEAPARGGWRQAFTKLDATLMNGQAVAANHREVEAWQS